MDKQDKRIIVRIDEDLKNKFQDKCNSEHLSISAKLKYLMQKFVEGKVNIND